MQPSNSKNLEDPLQRKDTELEPDSLIRGCTGKTPLAKLLIWLALSQGLWPREKKHYFTGFGKEKKFFTSCYFTTLR